MKNKELQEFSERFVLIFFQSGGSFNDRIDMLNKAIKIAGIDAIYTQQPKNGKAFFQVPNEEEFKKAENFKDEILKCWPLGQFEWEASAVKRVIENYRNK
jgi:hypothetical protein